MTHGFHTLIVAAQAEIADAITILCDLDAAVHTDPHRMSRYATNMIVTASPGRDVAHAILTDLVDTTLAPFALAVCAHCVADSMFAAGHRYWIDQNGVIWWPNATIGPIGNFFTDDDIAEAHEAIVGRIGANSDEAISAYIKSHESTALLTGVLPLPPLT